MKLKKGTKVMTPYHTSPGKVTYINPHTGKVSVTFPGSLGEIEVEESDLKII